MTRAFLLSIFLLVIALSLTAQLRPIDEQKFVSVNGIEQWITIKAEDSSKPVVLFLHGGPGSTMSPYDDAIYGKWNKDFILVNWDQRGAGKTFGRNAPAVVNEDYWIANPITVDQMTADGIKIAEYLTKYLGKQKIIIVATSWGTVLGAEMALKRPDLFHAYIGHSQVVNPTESLARAYITVQTMARVAKDQESIDKIRSIGPPPYDDAKNAGQLFRIIKKYERQNSTPAPDHWWKLASGYDNEIDSMHRYDGDDYSFINYMGHKKLGIRGMSSTVDLMKEDLQFRVPVHLIQGSSDILTSKEITKSYFDKLKAPKKKLYLISGAAHGHNQAIVDAQYKVLKQLQGI